MELPPNVMDSWLMLVFGEMFSFPTVSQSNYEFSISIRICIQVLGYTWLEIWMNRLFHTGFFGCSWVTSACFSLISLRPRFFMWYFQCASPSQHEHIIRPSPPWRLELKHAIRHLPSPHAGKHNFWTPSAPSSNISCLDLPPPIALQVQTHHSWLLQSSKLLAHHS